MTLRSYGTALTTVLAATNLAFRQTMQIRLSSAAAWPLVGLVLVLASSERMAALQDSTTVVVIPRTFAAVTQVQVRNAFATIVSAAAEKREVVSRLNAARAAYWACYPGCDKQAALEAEYSSWLLTKDLWSFDTYRLKISQPGPLMDFFNSLGGGELDGGIAPGCDALFAEWVFDFAGKGAAAAAGSRDREAAEKAFAASAPAYRRYQACRDKVEFLMGPKSPLRGGDPRLFLHAVLALTTDGTPTPAELARFYGDLSSVFGEKELLSAVANQMKLPARRGTKPDDEETFQELFDRGMTASGADPRVAAIAILRGAQYAKTAGPRWTSSWKSAEAEYRQRAAAHGTERLHAAAVRINDQMRLRYTNRDFVLPNPGALGCGSPEPKTCLTDLLTGAPPQAVDLSVPDEQLAARMSPPTGQAYRALIARIDLARVCVPAIQNPEKLPPGVKCPSVSEGINAFTDFIAPTARINAFLKDFEDGCNAERARSMPAPAPLVSGWNNCQASGELRRRLEALAETIRR